VSKIKVGAAQIPQTTDVAVNTAKVLETMEKAAREGVDLLCFPETHLSGYRVGLLASEAACPAPALEAALEEIAGHCRRLNMGAIVGTETPNGSAKPFNSAVILDREGKTLAVHHKSRLTPKDAEGYSPGTGPTLFYFDRICMGIVICFEGFRFPENVRELAKAGATIVFHPQFNHLYSDMAWKRPIQEALLMARAGENTIYFVSANMCHANNNCRSFIIGPDGLVIQASELGREMLLAAELETDRATHAFLKQDRVTMMKALAEM
jgi:ribosomal-protein-alanine N-acetyltransferase